MSVAPGGLAFAVDHVLTAWACPQWHHSYTRVRIGTGVLLKRNAGPVLVMTTRRRCVKRPPRNDRHDLD